MKNEWQSLTVTEVATAVYVPRGCGKTYHQNRPYHGLVLNDTEGVKDYIFSDGTVLHTGPSDLFYLPKGKTYTVKALSHGGCYAINFDMNIADEPFIVNMRSADAARRAFKIAEREWRTQSERCHLAVKRALYDIVFLALEQLDREYISSDKRNLIAPAVEKMKSDFTSPEMSVCAMADMCGITEAYFRRLFISEMGVSPKEYLINLRIGYACRLIESGQLSVGEIAVMCGYAEPCHFSREFKKHTGVAPAQYLNKC